MKKIDQSLSIDHDRDNFDGIIMECKAIAIHNR